ncbi:MAG: metalloregulator ArsR/SmtB family transcription factor [Ancalomicrobiaceae bacterium]|nr:metalloregulator ArsR/SmtB family transcription factor [Ancalomicrobiaceae bacterium]
MEDECTARQRAIAHPTRDELTLVDVLHALADPVRLEIVRRLSGADGRMNCIASAESTGCLSKSTLSHHFRILREAGIVRSERRGVELLNCLRTEDLESRFPGVLASILAATAGHAPTLCSGKLDAAGDGATVAIKQVDIEGVV